MGVGGGWNAHRVVLCKHLDAAQCHGQVAVPYAEAMEVANLANNEAGTDSTQPAGSGGVAPPRASRGAEAAGRPRGPWQETCPHILSDGRLHFLQASVQHGDQVLRVPIPVAALSGKLKALGGVRRPPFTWDAMIKEKLGRRTE